MAATRILIAVAVVLVTLLGIAASGAASPPDVGILDEQLTRLLTPMSAPRGTYEVYRSTRSIAELAGMLRALDPDPVADAWKVGRLGPADAFGSAAPYDAPKLARLYRGIVPLVARGSLRLDEGVVGYTLIAPWPDAMLTSLQPGTLVIVVHVTAQTGMR